MEPSATRPTPKVTRPHIPSGHPSMRGWRSTFLIGTLAAGLLLAALAFLRTTPTDSWPSPPPSASLDDVPRGDPHAPPADPPPVSSFVRNTSSDQNSTSSTEALEVGSAGMETPTGATQEDKPEPLPEYPKLNPQNTLTALNPEKTLFAEIGVVDGKKKVIRVGLVCEVCLREGPLEVFLCKKGTKEHEGIVRVDADAQFIHAALEAAGAKPGKPTQFVNPTTEQPEYKPATGDKIKVLVHYRHRGQTRTHPAQEWIWDRNKKMVLPYDWVFAGSVTIVDPDTGRKFYGANSGDIISISNFPYSLLEIPAEISKDDANLTYEARTAQIPPLWSKVWVILQPASADSSGR